MLTRETAFVDDVFRDVRAVADNNSYRNNSLDPVSWIEQNFYLYDTGQLITFHERQRRPLIEALREEDGQFVYSTILWSWMKKSAKSSVIAAVCLYVLCNTPRASISLIANDQKQSDSRVGYYLREAIKLAVKNKHGIGEFKITPSGYRIDNLSNGSFAEMLPIDPNGEAGGNSDLIVYSELHGWSSKAHQRMWSEMTLSPNKFGRSRRIIDTYSGYVGESPILEMLYQSVVKPEFQLWGEDWEVYVNPSARLFATWVTRWHLPWQVSENGRAYYAEESHQLTPNEFSRLHQNQWVTSQSVFVPGEWWDACREEIPPAGEHESMVGALDAAVSGDCFGIVVLSRVGDKTYKRYSRAWTPPKGGKIEYGNPSDPDDVNYPEGEIRRLSREYNIVEWAYDPFQLHDMCTRLMREGVGWFRPFPQGQDRLKSDKQLYDDIRDRRIAHDGDPMLSEHVRNANAEVDKEDHKLRIIKRAEHLKIDLCVAASMANHEARRLILT